MTSAHGLERIVLITGCSKGGIGFALCEEFASRGCIVYATSRKLEAMEGFQSPNIRTRVLDVTNEDDIERTVKGILEETGRIDIVVNNAGAITQVGPVAEATIEQMRKVFELNTFGALRLSNAVLPSMFERKQGLIVNIGSIGGQMTIPWTALYCGAKAALHTITEGLAMECKPFGIKVMLVVPGGVKSNIVKDVKFEVSARSVYQQWEAKFTQKTTSHNGPLEGGNDRNEFAKKLVARVLKTNPPPYVSLGQGSTLTYLCQWLPRQWVLWCIYKAVVDMGRT